MKERGILGQRSSMLRGHEYTSTRMEKGEEGEVEEEGSKQREWMEIGEEERGGTKRREWM